MFFPPDIDFHCYQTLSLVNSSVLTQERVTGRMVRPVNRRVAVGTAAVEVLDGAEGLRLRGMPAGNMACVADPRHSDFEQLRIAAAVRVMAVGAILHDRRMFPKKRPATLSVAT